MLLYLYFLLVFPVLFVDSRFFRNDYTGHSSIHGWIKYHQLPATWEEARLRCYYEGSILASPLNDGLLKTMNSAIGQSGPIFTGFSSIYYNGLYYSVEGVSLEQISRTWAPNEPNNSGHEKCIAMYSNGSFADVDCNRPLPYICYRKNSENAPAVNPCGTTDPEYNFEASLGSCYKFHTFGQSWARAFMACAAEGGHLVVINSEPEAKYLRELMSKYPAGKIIAKHRDIVAIGFHDWSQHGIFMTIHGESLQKAGYNIWAGGQPDNATTGEYCGSMFRDAKLNDIWCEDSIPFVCEKLPGSLLENDVNSNESHLN